MTSKQFVRNKYPTSIQFPVIDNHRKQTSYVIIKQIGDTDILPNRGATTASKAWTNARKDIVSGND